MPPKRTSAEIDRMYARYMEGASLETVGREFGGISRERVRQIFSTNRLRLYSFRERQPPKPPKPRKKPLRGVERTRHYAHMQEHRRAYEDEDLVAAIRAIATKSGRDTVTCKEYDAAYAADASLPSRALILSRLGWNRALVLAGLKPGRSVRTQPYSRVTAEQCAEALVRVSRIVGYLPSVSEYDLVRRNRPDLGLPSEALIRVRCGSWLGAVEAAAKLAER